MLLFSLTFCPHPCIHIICLQCFAFTLFAPGGRGRERAAPVRAASAGQSGRRRPGRRAYHVLLKVRKQMAAGSKSGLFCAVGGAQSSHGSAQQSLPSIYLCCLAVGFSISIVCRVFAHDSCAVSAWGIPVEIVYPPSLLYRAPAHSVIQIDMIQPACVFSVHPYYR